MVHSLANGPEVTKPLLETSRRGYLAASSASAFSMVSLVQKFAPIMPKGGSVVSLTYIASEKVRVVCLWWWSGLWELFGCAECSRLWSLLPLAVLVQAMVEVVLVARR